MHRHTAEQCTHRVRALRRTDTAVVARHASVAIKADEGDGLVQIIARGHLHDLMPTRAERTLDGVDAAVPVVGVA